MLREIISFLLYLIPLLLISFVTVFIIARISLYNRDRTREPRIAFVVTAFGIIYFIIFTTLLTYGKSLPISIWTVHWGWSIAALLLAGLSSFISYSSTRTLEWEGTSNHNIHRGRSVLIFLLSWFLMLIASAVSLILILQLDQN